MKKKMGTWKAFFIAGEVFVVLVVIFLFTWRKVSLDTEHLTTLLLGAIILCISLIAVNIFQALRVSENAKVIAKDMAVDIMSSSRELFSELYRSSPVPYILVDVEGKILSTNVAAYRLFKIKEGELDGRNIFPFIEGDDEQHVALYPGLLREGLFVNDEEVRVKRKDGSTRWVLFSLFSFKDQQGVRKGLLTFVDITKQKEIDKAKSEFVSLASHQLRTPISVMKWSAELLSSDEPERFTESQKENIAKIDRSLDRMDALVADFLNVSKLELGTLVADPKEVVLTDFVEDILREHELRIQEKNLVVKKNYEETPIMLETDPNLLHMAVSNIISNAAKYTPEGGVVTVSTGVQENKVVISVRDTGMGIPEDEQGEIFTKIFRASNVRSQVPEGTGLGLYIAREALKVLSGTITFTSKEGEGTTFIITLPR